MKYFAILTNQGAAKLANATALGTQLKLTHMATGDGNGSLPTPDPAQTKLVNQKRIAPLNMLFVDPGDANQIIAEQVIPENEGGFWIREIGLYDADGTLIAVANCPETYKPLLLEGSARTQTLRMALVVSATSAVSLKIDPAVVLATRKYVDDRALEVQVYTDEVMKKHLAADNPHAQYASVKAMAAELEKKLDKAVTGIILPAGYNIPFHIRNTQGLIYTATSPGTYTNEPEFDSEFFDVMAMRHSENNGGEVTFIAVSKSGKIATAALSGDDFSGWNPLLDFTHTTPAGRQLIGKNNAGEMVEYLGVDAIPGRLLNFRKMTTSGIYTPTAGTRWIIVEQTGAGGASGNLTATSTGENAISAAGSNGTYAKALITAGFSSVNVTIGSGGQPNGGAGGNGGNGGTTSFGSLVICPGGKGSGVGYSNLPPFNNGGATGSAQPTGVGILYSLYGISSPWPTVVAVGQGSNFTATTPTPLGRYGMGGDGLVSNESEKAKTGNAGTSGYVIVWEYA